MCIRDRWAFIANKEADFAKAAQLPFDDEENGHG